MGLCEKQKNLPSLRCVCQYYSVLHTLAAKQEHLDQ